jgi:hypothetical protein
MIPAGYMAKRVATHPDWLQAERVRDVYSVSDHVSHPFADYIHYWEHNGYWLFDSPQVISELAQKHSIDLTGTQLFFYEVFEHQFNDQTNQWVEFEPERSFTTQVLLPTSPTLEGYDIVTFSVGTTPECSPLSCNSLASELETNPHCLLTSLDSAKQLLQQGRFSNTEPGPYRIFAVYTTVWPHGLS